MTNYGNEHQPLRLFILEAPLPMDLLQNRSEAVTLEGICRLIGHEVAVLRVLSIGDLKSACSFIANIDATQDSLKRTNVPLCIHLAAHGNKEGLGIGQALIGWETLFRILRPLFAHLERYDGPVILAISACGAADQTLTLQIQTMHAKNGGFNPPIYLFVHSDNLPTFPGAAVSWAVFYYHLPGLDLEDKKQVQDALRMVKNAGAAAIKYYRWDKAKRKYFHHTPEKE